MLELYAIKAAHTNKKQLTPKEIKTRIATFVISVFIYIMFLAWAISRALKCSSKTPDSRAIHLFFCFASPCLYLVSSYTVSGFCKKG